MYTTFAPFGFMTWFNSTEGLIKKEKKRMRSIHNGPNRIPTPAPVVLPGTDIAKFDKLKLFAVKYSPKDKDYTGRVGMVVPAIKGAPPTRTVVWFTKGAGQKVIWNSVQKLTALGIRVEALPAHETVTLSN